MILANEASPPCSSAGARPSSASTSSRSRRRQRLSPSSPTSACRHRRRPRDASPRRTRRPRRRDQRAGDRVRRAGGPRPRGVPVARPTVAEAGAVRPAQPRPHRAWPAAPTATSPRRSGAIRTSCAIARCCASSASRTRRSRRRSSTSWRSRRRPQSAGEPHRAPRRRDLPCRAAGAGALRPWLGRAVRRRDHGADRRRAVRPLRRGLRGLRTVRRLPGDYFELTELGTALVGRRSNRTFRLGDAIQVTVGSVDRTTGKVDLAPFLESSEWHGKRARS